MATDWPQGGAGRESDPLSPQPSPPLRGGEDLLQVSNHRARDSLSDELVKPLGGGPIAEDPSELLH
jgi:hypothetical protein